MDYLSGDGNYFETYTFNFSHGLPYNVLDTAGKAVVNESFVKKVGWKSIEEAVGKEIAFRGDTLEIVGTVKDFHAQSLQQTIRPLLIVPDAKNYYTLNLKINPNETKRIKAEVEKVWASFYPEEKVSFKFLDERIEAFYQAQIRTLKLFNFFSGIAIFISCLGLYGLVSFMAVQKSKEVGIRKVLGASISSILILFSKEFVRLVIIALVIAAPISYYSMQTWLEDFAYRINIGLETALLSGLVAMIIAVGTIAYKSFRAAITNPVNSLKDE